MSDIRENRDANVFKVLLIVEAAGNGVSTQIVSYPSSHYAKAVVDGINENPIANSPIDGQSVVAVALF